MLNNFFIKITKEKYYKIITVFGIKFKILDKKTLISDLNLVQKKQSQNKILQNFVYSNINNWGSKEKEWWLVRKFYKRVGYYPNFKMPRSFNEKLCWMKINYDNPNEKNVCDKYEFKNYIKKRLGEGYTIPLIAGPFDDVNDIDFDLLPEKFVIKTTTNGAAQGVEIVTNKNNIDIDAIKYKFNNMIQEWNNIYYSSLPTGYKDVKPRIIVEDYMPIREGEALEYKMYCFHGEFKFSLIECDYFGKNPKRAFYDKNYNATPFEIGHMPRAYLKNKPAQYDEMVRISEILSKDFPFVRVDFYVIDNKIYVGELTIDTGGGFSIYSPREYDYKLGEWLDLNKLNPEYVHILPEFEQKAREFLDKKFFEKTKVLK